MPDDQPTTRAELRDAQPITAELGASRADFLPLNVRRGLYLAGLAALVIAPLLAPNWPEYADAITTSGNLLGAVGLGTALANPTR